MHRSLLLLVCFAAIALLGAKAEAQQPAPQPAAQPADQPAAQPAPRPAPQPAQPAADPAQQPATGSKSITVEYKDSLNWFTKGYGVVAANLIFQGWGQWTQSNDESADEDTGRLQQRFSPGPYLAGYAVLNEQLHIGGFYTFNYGRLEIEGVDLAEHNFAIDQTFVHNLGVTGKFGKPLSERLWIGGAVDLGLLLTKGNVQNWGAGLETKLMAGLSLAPRFDLDVMLVNVEQFKLAATASLGLYVVPVAGGHPFDTGAHDDRVAEDKARIWLISIQMLVGLTLGV